MRGFNDAQRQYDNACDCCAPTRRQASTDAERVTRAAPATEVTIRDDRDAIKGFAKLDAIFDRLFGADDFSSF